MNGPDQDGGPVAPWTCPVCRNRLARSDDRRRWVCPLGHSFDVAREGYVNLLLAGQRRSRQPGDSVEMVSARRRFLETGAYDPLSAAIADAVARAAPSVLVDVGCGEGRHTRRLRAPVVLGVDVAKPAVAAAARAHPAGWYAVASAADLPLANRAADVAVVVFGPVMAAELARVVRPGGVVIAAHPGPRHLEDLRAFVYAEARQHEVKPPLRAAAAWFADAGSVEVCFPVVVADEAKLDDLFAMTPYRWHAPPDIHARLTAALTPRFETIADVVLTTYRRTAEAASDEAAGDEATSDRAVSDEAVRDEAVSIEAVSIEAVSNEAVIPEAAGPAAGRRRRYPR